MTKNGLCALLLSASLVLCGIGAPAFSQGVEPTATFNDESVRLFGLEKTRKHTAS